MKQLVDRYIVAMPLGKTHLKIELTVWAACAVGSVFLRTKGALSWTTGGSFLSSYLFSSLFLSPDLDLAQRRASRRWGIGRVVWFPYAAMCRHRRLSHHLLFGPLTRILYLGGIVLGLLFGLAFLTGRSVSFSRPSWQVVAAILSGLYLPNQIHILVDWISSFRRRQARKRL